jgi:hypothetical protein
VLDLVVGAAYGNAMALRLRHRERRGGRARLLATWRLPGRRVARREGLRDRLVAALVVDAEALELPEERLLRLSERNSVLRPARAGEARLDVAEVELDDLRIRRLLVGVVPEHVVLGVRVDERDPLRRSPGQAQVLERPLVDGEEAAGGPVLRGHVPDGRAVGDGEPREPVAEVLHELPDDTGLPEQLGHGEDEVGGGRAVRQLAGEAEADDLRNEHRDRLAEHGRLGLDPPDAPAEHAEPVDHRGVRVGAEQRVRERLAVARLDHAREVLEIDLMADAGARRDDGEVVERPLGPAEQRVALAVPLELELGVARERAAARELVHLHGVVDDELRRDLGVDPRRVAAEFAHRVAHRREVNDDGDAGEVLVQRARRLEGDLLRGLGLGVPARHGLDGRLVALPEHVLEQDPQRVGQPRHVVRGLERVEPEDLVRPVSDAQRVHEVEAISRFAAAARSMTQPT